jgi:hypothetical protein
MDDSSSSITASISNLVKGVLDVRTYMNALSDRLTAQIQQLMTMVKALSKQPDLQRKLQRRPPWTSPTGLNMQDVQVLTSKSPTGVEIYLSR